MTLWHESGVPARHKAFMARNDKQTQPWRNALEAIEAADPYLCGLFVLIGGNGTGKTQLACETVRRVCSQGHPCLYQTMQQVAATFTDAGFAGRLIETFERYMRPRLLVLDDAQNVVLSDTGRTRVIELIDRRYRANLGVMIVTNQTEDAMYEALGTQVMQRVAESGGIVRCNWSAIRKNA